ncbi:hypothetical protein [Segetibacter koreensis]|uniref:hypothetical protein n=1 Tax=Segetibacter koreensis TaxID=398037 RepID=UPI000379D378|nr:hypothetical protein [Segetibacter koreensis]
MENYKGSESGGVAKYQIFDDAIILKFKDGRTYLYDYIKPGKEQVEKMKKLAVDGAGLTTYVNQHVRDNYNGPKDY